MWERLKNKVNKITAPVFCENMIVKSIKNINDLIEIFEEISEDIDINGQDRDFYKIYFMKEEIKTLLNCLKELKTE